MENKKQLRNNEQLTRELSELLNRHSLDNHCGMPDFILSDMVLDMLDGLADASDRRDRWLGLPDKSTPITLEEIPHELV